MGRKLVVGDTLLWETIAWGLFDGHTLTVDSGLSNVHRF